MVVEVGRGWGVRVWRGQLYPPRVYWKLLGVGGWGGVGLFDLFLCACVCVCSM